MVTRQVAKQNESLRSRALRMLARREYSRAELKTRLLPYAGPDEIDTLLDSLQDKNWLSDHRFSEEWVKQRSTRYGRQRLQYELQHKGVNPEIIRCALDNHLEDELSKARCIWQKKFAGYADNPKDQARQIRFLQYRGFSWEIIRQVLNLDDN